MVADGIYYAAALAAGAALVVYLLNPWWAAPLLLAAAFCLYFFRDPEREIPAGPVAVSPADGKVVALQPTEDGRTIISVFMSVFDVHVNRSPVSGVISDVRYRPGRFMAANRRESSIENEQNSVVVRAGNSRVEFRQIAGLIARRIVFRKKPGETVRAGERVGMIKFGSRVDLLLGPEWVLEVQEGDRVKAGSSVIARRGESKGTGRTAA